MPLKKLQDRKDKIVDVIDKLGERIIIPPDFASSIRGMAGFRNILIQGYL